MRSQPLDEAAYLVSLLRLAECTGKQAALGFSRSLGRVGAIKHVLGGHHIVLIRDPVQQWLSARSQRLQHGSPYFELGYLIILALASPLTVAGRVIDMDRLSGSQSYADAVTAELLQATGVDLDELVPQEEAPEHYEGPTATGAPRRS